MIGGVSGKVVSHPQGNLKKFKQHFTHFYCTKDYLWPETGTVVGLIGVVVSVSDSWSPHYQSPKSTQPSIPQGYVNRVPACMAGVKAGRSHLCRVAGNV